MGKAEWTGYDRKSAKIDAKYLAVILVWPMLTAATSLQSKVSKNDSYKRTDVLADGR